VRLWDVASGECVRVFEGHSDHVQCLDFSESGQYLVSGGGDGNVILWDIASAKKMAKFSGHRDAVASVCFSGDDTLIASGGLDNTVRIWSTAAHAGQGGAAGDVDAGSSAATGASGGGPAAAPQDNMLVDESGENSREVAVYQTKSTPVYTTRFTRKNLLLAAGVFV
jgi:transcription initiation factor TFIID subunit 5